MNSGLASLRDRLNGVRERIAAALDRSGRAPGAVLLVAVVKTVPTDRVTAILELGVADLGESRVQEAETRIAGLGRHAARWHFIGHLQRNKAGKAAQLFDRVHSLDSIETARALASRVADAGIRLPVLAEINISGEPTKHGVAPERSRELVEGLAALPGLHLDGLMTVGARAGRPDDARRGFARLRALRDEIEAATGLRLPQLSMGMSGDFEAAIAEGSTLVRVGTALFGPG